VSHTCKCIAQITEPVTNKLPVKYTDDFAFHSNKVSNVLSERKFWFLSMVCILYKESKAKQKRFLDKGAGHSLYALQLT